MNLFIQSNKPTGWLGEARQSGNSAVAAELAVLSRCASIFLITAGSSILATIRTSPPHSLQVSISMLKTRFSRFARVIARDGMYAGFAGAKTGHQNPFFSRGWICLIS